MMCPWKRFMKIGTVTEKVSSNEMDINNNLPKDFGKTHSKITKEAIDFNGTKQTMAEIESISENRFPEKIKQSQKRETCPKYLKLKNFENGSIFQDTLHLKAKKVRMKMLKCEGFLHRPVQRFSENWWECCPCSAVRIASKSQCSCFF
ncbi:hypothetical protein XELAEV_18014593mg [Xenopus laevis]|uniref:Nitric oxide synthase, inducible n=1 Tax=Xenopus laevis TaxID=8355 RepID=A0A974DIR3_XENLA|nr:hypothetical protein XELAEV_18014593mg [Xenopus laevis]